MKNELYKWAKDLFPINRSITGPGVRETLYYIKKNILTNIKIKGIKSGTKVFDWTVPMEWSIKSGYLKDLNGKEIINLKNNNLHVVGYSKSIKANIPLDQLLPHIHTLKKQPNAIPYVTSYYKKYWGFCMSENQKNKLKKGIYEVCIDSSYKKGFLNYGELFIKGKSKKEILLTTNICHPSMGNNETSGLVVLSSVARELLKNENKYSYRILFLPETIGSISYISKNLKQLKKNTIAGLVISCIGDKNNFSFIQSRYGSTITDKAIEYILKNNYKEYTKYSFLERGSDERQFCSPGVDLPICTLSRSKFGSYKEYHTSLDDIKFIKASSLQESSNTVLKITKLIEINSVFKNQIICEPFLSKYNLYPSLSSKNHLFENTNLILNILAYADGNNDLIDISMRLNEDIDKILKMIVLLKKIKLIK